MLVNYYHKTNLTFFIQNNYGKYYTIIRIHNSLLVVILWIDMRTFCLTSSLILNYSELFIETTLLSVTYHIPHKIHTLSGDRVTLVYYRLDVLNINPLELLPMQLLLYMNGHITHLFIPHVWVYTAVFNNLRPQYCLYYMRRS